MRRVVLVLATMALAILLAGGVAQAIINGEPDMGPNAHPYVGALVSVPASGEFKGQRIPRRCYTILPGRSAWGRLEPERCRQGRYKREMVGAERVGCGRIALQACYQRTTRNTSRLRVARQQASAVASTRSS